MRLLRILCILNLEKKGLRRRMSTIMPEISITPNDHPRPHLLTNSNNIALVKIVLAPRGYDYDFSDPIKNVYLELTK